MEYDKMWSLLLMSVSFPFWPSSCCKIILWQLVGKPGMFEMKSIANVRNELCQHFNLSNILYHCVPHGAHLKRNNKY